MSRLLLRRRLVLGALLVARRPMSVGELGDVVRRHVPTSDKAVADVLRYQLALGRVRRVAQGVDAVVPDALSTSMRQRCTRLVRQ